jgi:SAM-dependent methyltransferase
VHTFEHFVDPLRILLKIKGLLKNDGFLFIEVPNYYYPGGFYRRRYKGNYYPSSNHLFIYTPRTISAFLQKSGFQIYKIRAFKNIRIVAKIANESIDPMAITLDSYYRVLLSFYALHFIDRLAVNIYESFWNKKIQKYLKGQKKSNCIRD